ncbi:MAG: hypothetical protein ACHQWU_08305 [Gemmatimonadales bacterium]
MPARSRRSIRARRGIALVATLALMTVLGLLVVGAVGSVVVAQRGTELARAGALLDAAAGEAIGTLLADPVAYAMADLPLGRARAYSMSLIDGGAAVVSATRLPGGVLWLVAAVGSSGPDSGRRTVNLVARFPSVGPIPTSGLVARGSVVASDGVAFTVDSTSDADCAPPSPASVPDVTVGLGATASLGAGARSLTSGAAADPFEYFLTASQLASLDSVGAVVHVRGDTTIAGGSFDGLLVADGSIVFTGAFALSGLMVARDSIISSGGLAVRGAAMAFSAATAMRLAGATIEYAPCQIARALRRATRPAPVRGRAWAELF